MSNASSSHDTKKPQKKTGKDMPSNGVRTLLAIASLFSVGILGCLLAFAVYFLSMVMSGVHMGDRTSSFQASQILLWFTLLGLIIFALLVKLLRERKAYFLIYCRNLIYVFTPLIIVGTSIGFIVQSMQSGQERQTSINSGCDIGAQLTKARSATYFIRGDSGTGSAFAINGTGGLLTAEHVIDGNKNLRTVIIDAKGQIQTIPVTVVKTQPAYDLALLQISTPSSSFLNLSIPIDSLVGQDVYAVGFPSNTFDAGGATVTKGIFSRYIAPKDIPSAPADISFVQTDAALNPGNSGGPLISSCGAIGVNDAISESQQYQGLPRDEGIGYAVSAQNAKTLFGL